MRELLFYILVATSFSSPAFAQSAVPVPQMLQIAPATPPGGAATKSAKQYDPQKQCVDRGEFATELRSGIRPVGETIMIDSNFVPANQYVDIGVRAKYVEGMRYFAGIDPDRGEPYLLYRQDVLTRRATEADPLVKKRLLDADETIVVLTIPDAIAGFWRKADLYLYTCSTAGSPAKVSRAAVQLSPYWISLWICGGCVFAGYLLAAFVLRKRDHTFASLLSSLSPVMVSVGPDGKASLSKFQVVAFTLVVFGLFLLFWLQTGKLADMSGTILTLLGISGIGAVAAKGTDQQRNTILAENRAWLLRKNWIPTAKTPVDTSNASWRDFFMTNGEFDVYRYQSFVFSVVVMAALIGAGVTQLSSFSIPDTVLGIVGLSQAVYIGGKLVTPTNMSDLNSAIADLRDRERKFRDAATVKKPGAIAGLQEAVQLVGQPTYDAYKDKAKDVAALFTAETGIPVGPPSLEPSLD